MKSNILPFYIPITPDGVKKVKTLFSEGHAAYQIKGKDIEDGFPRDKVNVNTLVWFKRLKC